MDGFLIDAGRDCLTDPQALDLPPFDAAMIYPDDAALRLSSADELARLPDHRSSPTCKV